MRRLSLLSIATVSTIALTQMASAADLPRKAPVVRHHRHRSLAGPDFMLAEMRAGAGSATAAKRSASIRRGY